MELQKLLFIVNPRAGRNKPHGPLFDALSVDFGGLRPGRILPNAFFYGLTFRHWDTSARICRDTPRILR